MKNIFVNIASYRDNLLLTTINSLIKNESGRNIVTYGIFEQTALEDSLLTKNPKLLELKHENGKRKIKYKRIDPTYSDGVVWARAINSMQLNDEEFYYQIDSHMLFDKDWDHFLILDYNQAKSIANTEKLILTTGCKNFEVKENQITKHTLSKDATVKFRYYQFKKNLHLKSHGSWEPSTETVTPAIHAIAGNFFTISKWVKDVGYNTRLYFNSEEQYMAISSILAGYKIFHQRKMKCYHFLGSSNHLTKQDLNPVIEKEIIDENIKKDEKELIDYIYSLSEEQLLRYYQETGVDYINRKIEDRSLSQVMKPEEGIEVDWIIDSSSKKTL